MKLYDVISYLGYLSGIFGGLMMLAGVIGFLTGTEFLGVKYYYNYFFYANSFLLFGVFIILGTRQFCHCHCHTHDDACQHEDHQK
ncbi:MAG TPA: hypothetical protein PLW31_08070 [Bacteroidales bacterium]|nr:hypothetical protein [Bacteroidales bacterium]HNQ82693.1 hypothetical protein [Bacteroidales bacterium]HOX77982.1 hypothetical protein [Bacteroidales bacterium]HPM92797.1 hypothetical protein [Bacteroidales bacterium]